MADYQSEYALTAQSVLGGVALDYKLCSITEVTDVQIASLACAVDAVSALQPQVNTALQADLPSVGEVSLSADEGVMLLGLQRDQWWVLSQQADSTHLVATLGALVGDKACITEQSDAWVALRLTGPGSRRALERICMPDLDPAVFPQQRVMRTTMEHLGVILVHEGPERYLLLSARSSAEMCLHALTLSVAYTE